jgi:hypothetical protein
MLNHHGLLERKKPGLAQTRNNEMLPRTISRLKKTILLRDDTAEGFSAESFLSKSKARSDNYVRLASFSDGWLYFG